MFIDPPEDPEHPFLQTSLTIPSEGCELLAVFEQTTGTGPHPTILLLHGFPGNEKNIDLAQSLKRVGFNVLLFHYKGSWGSPGNYSFSSCIRDTKNAIKFLLRDDIASKFRIDRKRICIIGHSLGGFLSIVASSEFNEIHNLVAISPVNMSTWANQIPDDVEKQKKWGDWMKDYVLPLKGTSPQILTYDLLNNINNWNITTIIQNYENKKLLLLAASEDSVLPLKYHHEPIQGLKLNYVDCQTIRTDHQYSNSRIQLTQIITDWLISTC